MISILDPMTKQRTAFKPDMEHEQLEHLIMQFVNNTGVADDSMTIGRLGEQEVQCPQCEPQERWKQNSFENVLGNRENTKGELNYMGKGRTQGRMLELRR